MTKRPLLLADRLISSPSRALLVKRHVVNTLQGKIRSAHKFVFAASATTKVAEVIRDVPDLLAREIGFARPPYDVTWIEMDSNAYAKVLLPGIRSHLAQFGYLIDHGSCYCVITDRSIEHGENALVIPVCYELHTPSDASNYFKLSDDQLDMIFWGVGHDKLEPALRAKLRANHSVRLLPIREGSELIGATSLTDWLHQLFDSTAGDLCNIITALLLLNRPSLTTFTTVPRASGLVRGKVRTYFAHSTVTFLLDPLPTLRLLGTERESGVVKRRHEVRGHYCHNENGRSRDCVHEWDVDFHREDDPKDPDHWKCRTCGGKRWWRTEHHRGSAEVGFVVKEKYSVVGKSDRD